MAEYFEAAKGLAERFNSCPGVKTVPEVLVSNMFHVYFEKSADEVGAILTKIQDETGIGISGYLQEKSADVCAFEVSVGDAFAEIPVGILESAFECLEKELKL